MAIRRDGQSTRSFLRSPRHDARPEGLHPTPIVHGLRRRGESAMLHRPANPAVGLHNRLDLVERLSQEGGALPRHKRRC